MEKNLFGCPILRQGVTADIHWSVYNDKPFEIYCNYRLMEKIGSTGCCQLVRMGEESRFWRICKGNIYYER